ncbi:MAG: glycosyltransferase family 9 protein, partial [Chloroflexota bacterium]
MTTDHPEPSTVYNTTLVPGVRKIAVLRSNGIGDFMFCLPALEALRHAYPEAEIVLLGLDWHSEFMEGRPGPIDRVEVIPPIAGIRNAPDGARDPAEVECFFGRMEAERFDIALQMHGGGRNSNPVVRRLGARITAGARTADAIPLDRWIPYIFYQPEVMRYLEIAALVGARQVSLEPSLVITEKDIEEANHLLPASPKPLVVLHPGAGDPRRRWPVENFAAVGKALARAGAQCTVIGSGPECRLADRLVGMMSGEAENL